MDSKIRISYSERLKTGLKFPVSDQQWQIPEES